MCNGWERHAVKNIHFMSLCLNNAQQIHHNVQEVWLELEKIRNYIQASGPLLVNVYRSWRILEKAGKPRLSN